MPLPNYRWHEFADLSEDIRSHRDREPTAPMEASMKIVLRSMSPLRWIAWSNSIIDIKDSEFRRMWKQRGYIMRSLKYTLFKTGMAVWPGRSLSQSLSNNGSFLL